MKKIIINTIIFSIILSGIVFVMPHNTVHAGEGAPVGSAVTTLTATQSLGTNVLAKIFGFTSLVDLINSALATIVNLAIAIAGFILGIAAYILDISIGLTLNIKAFVESTPAIYAVWRILRDITGLFFIFYLLYAAIQMMTGFGKGPSYGSIVKNIIIAGILINFSFFIVSVGIDFSNVISQAIYQAMIPNHSIVAIKSGTTLTEVVGSAGKSNISNIFMNSLKIQQIYDTNGNRLGTNVADPIKTALIGVAGVVMMLTTAVSFVLAALAFIARLVILLFLLAFSSLWFVGWIIPQVNKELSFFQGQLYSQLIFMPVYLLLMYVALTIVNGSNMLGAGRLNTSAVSTAENWIMPYVLLSINFAIIIIILNLPLIIGLSMGGWATGWLKKSIDKWDARKVWGNIGSWTSGTIGTNTAGRLASKADTWFGNTRVGNSIAGRTLRNITTGAVASSKFGGSKKYSELVDTSKERKKKGAEIKRKIDFDNYLTEARSGTIAPANQGKLKESLKLMGMKEKMGLGSKTLMDKNVIKHLSSDDFKTIREDKDGNFSEKEKADIVKARFDALAEAVRSSDNDTIKHMVSNMDGKDLLKAQQNNPRTLINPLIIENLKVSQLKTMEEEGLDGTLKSLIKNSVNNSGPGTHSAYGWVNKNW